MVADGQGNVLSVIQSLFNAFGSGVVAARHRRCACRTAAATSTWTRRIRASLAPRKRPFHTLMASITTRDDRPVMGFATMGGNGQAMFHVQVLTNVFDYGLDIQEAIERPRFLIGAFLPDEPADLIHLESRVPRARVRRARSDGATRSRRRRSCSTGSATPTASRCATAC